MIQIFEAISQPKAATTEAMAVIRINLNFLLAARRSLIEEHCRHRLDRLQTQLLELGAQCRLELDTDGLEAEFARALEAIAANPSWT